jgi:hypothetical protein
MSRVLIAEDHADTCPLIRMTGDMTGHQGEVEVAAEGQAGRSLALTIRDDVGSTGLALRREWPSSRPDLIQAPMVRGVAA